MIARLIAVTYSEVQNERANHWQDTLELGAEMDIKHPLIEHVVSHCLVQRERCAGMIQTTTLCL
jgi:hypothetical protein